MTGQDVRREQGWAQWLIYATMGCLLIVGILLAKQAWTLVHRPPPFHFAQAVYLPKNANICPGDTVEWKSKLVVTRAPTVLVLARTLWDASEQVTLIPDEMPDHFVWTEETRGTPIDRPARYKLPDDLPVGLYEIRVGASSPNSDAASYRVPFVIAESCFGGGK